MMPTSAAAIKTTAVMCTSIKAAAGMVAGITRRVRMRWIARVMIVVMMMIVMVLPFGRRRALAGKVAH